MHSIKLRLVVFLSALTVLSFILLAPASGVGKLPPTMAPAGAAETGPALVRLRSPQEEDAAAVQGMEVAQVAPESELAASPSPGVTASPAPASAETAPAPAAGVGTTPVAQVPVPPPVANSPAPAPAPAPQSAATPAPRAAAPPREQTVQVWMKVTAYCPCAKCCGRHADGITASGKSIHANGSRFVAADTSVLPMHTMVSIPGYDGGRMVPVLDRGGKIKGSRLDVFFRSHAEARKWGVRWVQVTVRVPADPASPLHRTLGLRR